MRTPESFWVPRPRSSEISEVSPQSRVIVQDVLKLCFTQRQLL
jgi:hypothetical protein